MIGVGVRHTIRFLVFTYRKITCTAQIFVSGNDFTTDWMLTLA